MAKVPTDLIGGYLSTVAAHEDYEAVLNCGAEIMGAVVVSKDLEGNLSVEQTDQAASIKSADGYVSGRIHANPEELARQHKEAEAGA